MTIQSGPATNGQKELKTKWPVVEGLTAATTKQVGKRYLTPTKSSLVSKNDKIGL